LVACSDGQQQAGGEAGTASPADDPGIPPGQVEKGMFFKPDLGEFALHNEQDADGDGDGIKETHIQRYINQTGDTAFSMTTGEHLWAWSLDTKDSDGSDIHKDFVIRDSNCDGVFDERYSLEMEFQVPDCAKQEAAGVAGTPEEV
jgi:hypothetical protein